ncbi:FG-GAP repeat domain-containing protein [Kitasatospora sp. NPDC048298]|uniref:FG-GAP repeat domain-containing protein n=1 Tax=Kitasatospora sp. NPDC048298 TaxID=3364049 RepID=UPI00371E7882
MSRSSRTSRAATRSLAALVAASACATVFTAAAPVQAASSAGGTITRSEVLARAQSWVDQHVPYNQGGWWTDSNGTYREDCSGYISMAWHLTSSLVTQTLPNVSTKVPFSDLKPGDALDYTAEHTFLFAGWTNKANGDFTYYAESNRNDPTHGPTRANINSSSVEGWPTSYYVGLRYKNIVDDAVPEPPKLRLDFNGDGKADVAGKLSDGNLLLWTGNGNGTLNTASGYSMWPGNGFGQVSEMVAADFNGDGKTDIAGKLSDGNLLLWTGNGDGTLNTASGYSMWPDNGFKDVSSLVAGDFNGDGKADIAGKLSDGNLLLWLGNGNGTLDTKSGYSMWPDNGFGQVGEMVAADFNGDGKTDIAGKLSDGNLLLWLGNGNGTLDTKSGYSMWPDNGFKAVDNLVADDFNGDGKADIAGKLSDGNLLLWTGNGDGTLNTASGYSMWPDNGFKAVDPLIG